MKRPHPPSISNIFSLKGFVGLALCLFIQDVRAQNIPVVDDKGWMFTAGNSFSIPVSSTYSDFSLVKYSDYFWEYRVTPLCSWVAPYVGLARVKSASFRSNNTGFYSYGLYYRQSSTSVYYRGWEGGGTSGVFYEGTGRKTWRDHFIEAQYAITHQFGVGRVNRTVLNTLNFTSAWDVYASSVKQFSGAFNGDAYDQVYRGGSLPRRWYIPQLRLNYQFSVVLHSPRLMIIPHVATSLLCFNNFLRLGKPGGGPLERRPEYYKEISFGVSLMRR